MSINVARPSVLWRIPGCRSGNRPRPRASSYTPPVMKEVSMSSHPGKRDDHHSSSQEELHLPPSVPQVEISGQPDLRFDRLQPPEQLELDSGRCRRRVFGRFVAREALIDEEYWTAAWLRAESNWEDQSYMRYVDNYKRKFAEQEFTALKGRCNGQHAEKCICIIAVKKEEKNVKRKVLNSIVGTLDISVRHLFQGETFPGDRVRTTTTIFSNIYQCDQPRYVYIANLCVAKYARRQGIASNMLHLAVEAAKSHGVSGIFVHVKRDNMPARQLYEKIGFQIVEMAMDHSLEEENYLMCLKC